MEKAKQVFCLSRNVSRQEVIPLFSIDAVQLSIKIKEIGKRADSAQRHRYIVS